MIFLELYTLPNATQPDEIITQIITQVPSFTPLLLAFIFFTIFIGGIVRQSMKIGTADYSMWAVIAAIGTLITTLIMTTATGFVNLSWLVVVVVVTIFCGLWFFLDRSGGA